METTAATLSPTVPEGGNPTEAIDLEFAHYLAAREAGLSAHLVGGVPDYAFSLDLTLRQKLAVMKPVRAFAQAIIAARVPLMKEIKRVDGVAVGPKQYPEIYEMVQDCARTLGIGVPEVFIERNTVLNAYTLATNDAADMIVLHSELVEAMTPAELKFIIGHECGHIHNLHSVYNTAAEILAQPALGTLLASIPGMAIVQQLILRSFSYFLSHWSRCAEITCDRAGAICCGDVAAGQTALVKLKTGGGDALKGINMEQYLRQLKDVQNTPLRLLEMERSHPLIPKRVQALRLWADCDVFHSWRPEMRAAAAVRAKDEVDRECASFINVFAKGYSAPDAPASRNGADQEEVHVA